MIKECSTQKLYLMVDIFLALGYICVLINSNIIRKLDFASLEIANSLIYIAIAWMPVIIIMLVCIPYAYIMVSNKYLRIRKIIYFE